jgi:hypothetical protein
LTWICPLRYVDRLPFQDDARAAELFRKLVYAGNGLGTAALRMQKDASQAAARCCKVLRMVSRQPLTT